MIKHFIKDNYYNNISDECYDPLFLSKDDDKRLLNEVSLLYKKVIHIEKCILNIKEICEYTGWGETKVREILKRPNSTFTIKMGNRLYANKKLFDEYLDRCAKYQISI